MYSAGLCIEARVDDTEEHGVGKAAYEGLDPTDILTG
jgi:hypothetical protein